MISIKHDLLRPFGPSIFKAEMPSELVNKLNSYVDEIIDNNKKSIELDHGKNLTGDVTQEFKLEIEFMKVKPLRLSVQKGSTFISSTKCFDV